MKWIVPLAIVCVGTFAAVLLTASIAISPSLALLDATHYVLVKQAQIRVLQVSMTIISSLYTALALAILVLARKDRRAPLFRLTAAALVLIVIALVYSAPTDIAYNQQILSWDAAAPPANWATVRGQWDLANRVRTIPSMVAFLLQALGALYVPRT